MTTRDFAFWLMGSLELIEPEDGLNEKQTQMLKNHLNMVFIHMVNDDGTLKDEDSIDLTGTRPSFDEMTTRINC